MKYNQVIWDALVWAHENSGNRNIMSALEEYAADCDGRLFVSTGAKNDTRYEFVPHSNPMY